MGRGSYIGGGTVIHTGSDWFSGHDGDDSRGKRKSAQPCSPEALDFLKLVIESPRIIPEVPKTMSVELAREVGQAGGPWAWATTRKEFDLLSARAKISARSQAASPPPKDTTGKLPLAQRLLKLRTDFAIAVLAAEDKGKAHPPFPRALRLELIQFAATPEELLKWAQLYAPATPSRAPLAEGAAQPAQKITPISLTDRERVHYLTAVVSAMLRGRSLPRPANQEPGAWVNDWKAAVDAESWARQQPEFRRIYDKVSRKLS